MYIFTSVLKAQHERVGQFPIFKGNYYEIIMNYETQKEAYIVPELKHTPLP